MSENKASNQRIHAQKRAFERYNLILSDADIGDIIALIKNRQAVYVTKRKRRKLYIVPFRGQNYPVVIDRATDMLCTFIPWARANTLIRKAGLSEDLQQ